MKWETPAMDVVLIDATQNIFMALSTGNTGEGPTVGEGEGGW